MTGPIPRSHAEFRAPKEPRQYPDRATLASTVGAFARVRPNCVRSQLVQDFQRALARLHFAELIFVRCSPVWVIFAAIQDGIQSGIERPERAYFIQALGFAATA